jgi:hypothetical protein
MHISLLGDPKYGIYQRSIFLGSFISGPVGLAQISSGAPIYHDDRPVLDYAVHKVRQKDTNEVPIVALLRKHLDPVGQLISLPLDSAESLTIEQVREKNLDDLVATALRRR